jgi:hypothetical protein
MASKVLGYLQERAGQEVTVGEMMEAGLAPTMGTLMTYLSKLVLDPRSGVTRLGLDKRTHGVNRPYRYDPPAEEVRLTLLVVGETTEGHALARDAAGVIYEVRKLGAFAQPSNKITLSGVDSSKP